MSRELVIAQLRAAKQRVAETLEPEVVEHDGEVIADVFARQDSSDPLDVTVFVRLTGYGRFLVGPGWNCSDNGQMEGLRWPS